MNFWNTFVSLCNSIDKSPNAVAKELKISSGALSAWKQDASRTPQDRILQKIADYFNISVDYLLGYEVQEKNNDAVADIVIRLRRDIKFFRTVSLLDKANDEQLSLVENMLLAFK